MCGPDTQLEADVRAVARWAVAQLDLRSHRGVHPRIGVLDVVPWIDLDDPWSSTTGRSLAARDRFADWAGDHLAVPCFVYGPERTLPQVRRQAWRDLRPGTGPDRPHPSAGAIAVGVRGVLVAYNLWLDAADVDVAKRIATAVRRAGLRTLGLAVGNRYQVSCNLTEPSRLGPGDAYNLVAAEAQKAGADVTGAELVGLLPRAVLETVSPARWAELDISAERTIEARLAAVGR